MDENTEPKKTDEPKANKKDVGERVSFKLRRGYAGGKVTLPSDYKTAKDEGEGVVSVDASEASRLDCLKIFTRVA